MSHSWLMLSRLCFSPSTYKTSWISKILLSPIKPLPRILPLLLSPYVTCPSSLKMMFTNLDLSPVMCFEQPLSRYHNCMLSINFPYKRQVQVQRFGPLTNMGPLDLHSSLGTSEFLGIHLIMPLGTKYFLILQNLTEWHLYMQ